jgi:hypothetical protein
MASEGMEGLYVETRNYGATAAFWQSLGYRAEFETDHGSGQWRHPAGGPYLFIAERQGADEVVLQPILAVADAAAFAPERAPDWAAPWEPQHFGVLGARLRDPDGREVGLHAPLPDGVAAPDMDAHHDAVHGSH